ncbi:uncharacterized protein si:ch73-6k14.2 [Pygocentrus nattereri]|uniref:uncharacterized protein si:ch73-6k14.2 n=1 Tax=Pygocentrus nattereri TaxID=42514 RepID=UPI0018915392|nr:uncharacterized protein si:ch73-6k14.2 [Pygocentrus nattereri]XP_037399676.1 uncharacterized protein si:ch73-6k14.2 [Pygocentrus nattereri]
MKPRRFRTSVDLLPTITELQENEYHTQSLDDYMDSIRELSQPAYPLSGPLQGSRLPVPRMARFPTMPSVSHRTSVYKPLVPIGPDNVSLTLVVRLDLRAVVCPNQDPLDWLFTQAQTGGHSTVVGGSEEICIF